ncbi:TetR/AcrR family transcriptional regulator; helix-turn-helix transcriptional regulator [Pseudonocardia sp. RS11V-5]|uniref:TetR/AcrR family transcriptional regulator n=1 Tax=Pseudonocardia terrae TaxID=2905831 RepID=UPI001E4F9335|nr:TetR/AcrR family transcriptional regulator [Pseudonocardia terrae]MCE3551057.1 TetR/AcrR family transcriptional regulator; helix-turn-helix transcriptional regulator [Pseudonocardia terrae]
MATSERPDGRGEGARARAGDSPARADSRRRTALARRARTRTALIAAARSVFADQGWAETRVEDVARVAGVSVATAYNHFSGKHALIGAAYAVAWQEGLDAEPEERPTADGPPLPGARTEDLAAHLRRISRVARRYRALTAAFAGAVQEYTARVGRGPSPLDPEDPRVMTPVPERIAVLLDAAQRAGELGHQRDPADLAEQLTFLLFLRCFTHPDEDPADTAAMLLAFAVGVLPADEG